MKSFKEKLAKPCRIAMYSSLDSDFCYVTNVTFTKFDEHFDVLPDGAEREKPMKGFVRISEIVEVELRPVSDDTAVANAMQSLDQAEREAIQELNAKIASIREQKSQLLALTHNPETV